MVRKSQEVFELLESFYRVTLAMKEEVDAGQWDNFSLHVQERQEVIENLSDSLMTLGEEEKRKALSILIEVLHLDENIRNKMEDLMHQDLLRLKEEQDKLSALRKFREGIMPSSPPPRFLEKRG